MDAEERSSAAHTIIAHDGDWAISSAPLHLVHLLNKFQHSSGRRWAIMLWPPGVMEQCHNEAENLVLVWGLGLKDE